MNDPALTADLLHPVVTALHGRPATVRPGWRLRPIRHVRRNPVTAGLYQVSGHAAPNGSGAPVEWAVVLKALRCPNDAPAWLRGDQPSHWNYWKREALAYRGGLLASIADGLAVPRFLAVHEPDEDTVWLWLQHVDGIPATAWPPDRYPSAARDLAVTQGPYLVGRPLPNEAWLVHDWLDAWTPALSPASLGSLDDGAAWAHPLIRQVLPREVAGATRRLAADRDGLVAAAARLPATVCHHDFWPPNLLSSPGPAGAEQTVALDWSWVGIGAAGLDAANLVLDATSSGFLPSDRLAELDEAVLGAYLDGLHDAGWRGTATPIRIGHDVTAALRFGLDAPNLLAMARDPARQTALEQRHGRPIQDIIASRAAVIRHALALADRARTLLGASPGY